MLHGTVETNPLSLEDPNEWQTPSKSFNTVACPSQKLNSGFWSD
jgi:hypothetical protein